VAPGLRHRHRVAAVPAPDVDFSHPRMVDSDTVLRLQETPSLDDHLRRRRDRLRVRQHVPHAGVKVDLINTRDKLLSFLDDEIIDALSLPPAREGCVMIRHNEEI
jgi:NAD(P) transhydrogenase